MLLAGVKIYFGEKGNKIIIRMQRITKTKVLCTMDMDV